MKLVAIGLAADSINQSVASHFLAALQFSKDTIARRVDPNVCYLFRQTRT